MITYHTCQHALDGANPVLPSMPYPRKIPLANLAHICCPCHLGCQEHGVFMNRGLWDCALYALWSLMVALLCFSLYELRPRALPWRKPYLGLMAGLELGPLCCRGMWPARQALPPAAASVSVSCVPVNSLPFVSTSPLLQCFTNSSAFKCLPSRSAHDSMRARAMPGFLPHRATALAKLSAWHMKGLNSCL